MYVQIFDHFGQKVSRIQKAKWNEKLGFWETTEPRGEVYKLGLDCGEGFRRFFKKAYPNAKPFIGWYFTYASEAEEEIWRFNSNRSLCFQFLKLIKWLKLDIKDRFYF